MEDKLDSVFLICQGCTTFVKLEIWHTFTLFLSEKNIKNDFFFVRMVLIKRPKVVVVALNRKESLHKDQ